MERETILIPAKVDVKRLPLNAVEAFVLSQVDGQLTLEDIAEVAGIDFAKASGLAKRLVELGAVTTYQPYTAKKSKAPPARVSRPPRIDPRADKVSLRPPRHDPRADKVSMRPPRVDPRADKVSLRPPRHDSSAKKAATTPPPRKDSVKPRRPSRKSLKMAKVADDSVCELDAAVADAIIALDAKLGSLDHYAALEVERGAEKKAIKRAYYALASKYHPDRFFGKKLGKVRAPLDRVFHRITEAHDVLTDKVRRAEYDLRLPRPRVSKAPPPKARTVPPKARTVPPRKPSKKMKAVSARPPKKTTTPPKRTSRQPPSVERVAPMHVPIIIEAAPVSEGSLKKLYAAAQQIEAQRHVELFLRAAEEALKVDDVIGAANNYRLALQNRDDPYIRRKLDDIDAMARTRRHEMNLTRARAAERDRKWGEAAIFYAKAHDARPAAPLAERAANAFRMTEGGDLERALELGEYAVAADPRNAGYKVTLAEVHLANGDVKSAIAECDRALEIASSDPRVKDLAAFLKKKRK